jgi:hypothetical protein
LLDDDIHGGGVLHDVFLGGLEDDHTARRRCRVPAPVRSRGRETGGREEKVNKKGKIIKMVGPHFGGGIEGL